MQALFLCTLFLYPFSAVDHTLYMIPQFLLLAVGTALLPQMTVPNASAPKMAISALAFMGGCAAVLREGTADRPEFLEPVKLAINLSTVLLFLFLAPALDFACCAKWLKRFAMIWLALAIGAYLYAQTSTWEMVLLIIQPEGVTSTRLYEIAEPLSPLFLTKNIAAMYFVAVFGAFLYFRRSAGRPVAATEKALFMALVVALFSRQAVLSGVLLLALDYFLARGRKHMRWAFVIVLITALAIGSFLVFAFDFSSSEDGASTRIDLWREFFAHWRGFGLLGLGVHDLNTSLEHLDIDNYHMFFMNQIAAYGIVHCLVFNLALTIITLHALPRRSRWLVVAPYWLNVCFQTYGYEYGNLFLFCLAANSCNLHEPRFSAAADWADRVLKPLTAD